MVVCEDSGLGGNTMKNIFCATDSGLAFTDPHDRNRYPVAVLNNRLWMISNLKRFAPFQSVSHGEKDVDDRFGLLYRCDEELESILPEGFRLPSADEFMDFFAQWRTLVAVHPLDIPLVLSRYGDIPLAGTAFQANPCGGSPEFKDFGDKGVYLTNSRDEQGYLCAVCITRDGCQITRVLSGEHCSIRLTLNTETLS